jgi:hypothetical protein
MLLVTPIFEVAHNGKCFYVADAIFAYRYRFFGLFLYPQASFTMSRYREWDLSCKVYVGNLGSSASKHEIESAFSKYGPLRNVWVARNPPGFAFVEFEDPRDAEDAVRGLDGTYVRS